jgi:tetratricopeptide (TPR) repeat protein
VDTVAPIRPDRKALLFGASLFVLLLLVAAYTAVVGAYWSGTPLGQRPQGDSAAWLAGAESLYQGTALHEPFFRAPAYLAILAMLRMGGVSLANLPMAARVLNGGAHLWATALVVALAARFWRRKAALVAGVLFGFYPPIVFQALQPGPDTLAQLAWLIGVAAALGTVWQSPMWSGGRISRRHAWAYPAIAGTAFVLAAALSATFWPTALAWPVVALFSWRGFGAVAVGLVGLQLLWGGSPQPLAGVDLYRLDQACEITLPWTVPITAVEIQGARSTADQVSQEAVLAYEIKTGKIPSGNAVANGYWWRAALQALAYSPARSALRAARKFFQFIDRADYAAGPDYSRARDECDWLKLNPLNWTVLLALGVGGLLLGWRCAAAPLAVLLAILAGAGAMIWYPTMEARAPVVALLAVFSGAIVGRPWPRAGLGRLAILASMLIAAVLAWLPRSNDPSTLINMREARQRATAWVALGNYREAIHELDQPGMATQFSIPDRDMIAGWRFTLILKNLPKSPLPPVVEQQLLENAELAQQSPGAAFRAGACLWLLGRFDGALYYWENLADADDVWGADARQAIALSSRETPAQAQRREAWELGASPQPDPQLTPFFALMSSASLDGK